MRAGNGTYEQGSAEITLSVADGFLTTISRKDLSNVVVARSKGRTKCDA